MASQTTQRVSSTGHNGSGPSSTEAQSIIGEATHEALAAASSVAQQATEGAKQSATYAINMVSGQLRELLDQQVVYGADIVGHVANSVQLAADDLDENVPQVGKLVRALADRAEAIADDIREQSAEELVQNVVDFTRRQPALTFGLAALAGFVVFRALKSSEPTETPSPSIQPGRQSRKKARSSRSSSHGA